MESMNRTFLRHGCTVLLATLLGGLVPAASRAAETEVYLSWGSPHGTPGARDTLVRACGDSMRVDTLYLSFVPGEDLQLIATTNEVEFAPINGDTLLGYWSFRNDPRGGPGTCRGEFLTSATAGCPFPWPEGPNGAGAAFYRRGGKGVVRLGYAVSAATPSAASAGTHYCLARILIRHHAKGSPGCDQPLRVTWTSPVFHLSGGQDLRVPSGSGHPVYLRTREPGAATEPMRRRAGPRRRG